MYPPPMYTPPGVRVTELGFASSVSIPFEILG